MTRNMAIKQPKFRSTSVEFRILWLNVEHEIGNAYISVFAEAQSIDEFIIDLDSQSNPLHSAIKQSYQLSRCKNLNSAIDPFNVLDVLGETLYQQKHRDHVDVTLIDLIERIGLHICKKYIQHEPLNKSDLSSKDKRNTRQAVIRRFKPK